MSYFITIFTILVLIICSEAMPKTHHGIPLQPPKTPAPADHLGYDVIPRNYKIDLIATEDNIIKGLFSGRVRISLNVRTNLTDFRIHAKEITVVGNVTLTRGDFSSVLNHTSDTNFLNFVSDVDIVASNEPYTLTIGYTGKLSKTDLEGFYQSTYVHKDGELHYLATTQFALFGARRAFPCFDEPAFKATFDISITHSEGYNALSNAEILKKEPRGDGTVKSAFETTPFMSTYLVAFIVSEFECLTADSTEDGISTEVCIRDIPRLFTINLAMDTQPKALNEMAHFTRIKYKDMNLGKMSLAAIPNLPYGAMENWGMVTYRESDVLWDTYASSDYYKQTVVRMITHEISHQWFGDKVTMDWWTNIFLNEGFATYFEYLGTANIDTARDWEMPKQFVVEQLQPVLVTDSDNTSLPLSYQTDDPEVISDRFDDISYNKGGSILRMIHHFLGLDNFKKGLTDYLNLSPIGTPTNLWNSLNKYRPVEESEKLPTTLPNLMEKWTYKAGYPCLTVTLDEKSGNITISQTRFLIYGEDDDKTEWYVPITYTTNISADFANTATKAWLIPGENLTLSLDGAGWIVLNNQQVGYYRVNYDDKLLDKILTVLSTDDLKKIDEITRSQIVDDQLNFARAGLKDYGTVLGFLQFLKNEDSYYTWSSAFNGFDYLLKRTSDEKVKQALNNYIFSQMDALLKSVNSDSEDHISILKEVMANTWACKFGQVACIVVSKDSLEQFQAFRQGLAPNSRSYVYCYGLRNSDNATAAFEFLYDEYKISSVTTEKVTILKGLGCVDDSYLRMQYLNKALTDEVRIQDATYVFSSVYSHGPGGVDDALTFITKNYAQFEKRFGTKSTLNSLIYSVADSFTTQAQIDILTEFSKTTNLEDSIKAACEGAAQNANNNLKKIEEIDKSLTSYFELDKDEVNSQVINSNNVINLAAVLAGYLMFNF